MTSAELLQWFADLAQSKPSMNDAMSGMTISERGSSWRASAASRGVGVEGRSSVRISVGTLSICHRGLDKSK
jgi:hypothetical protein